MPDIIPQTHTKSCKVIRRTWQRYKKRKILYLDKHFSEFLMYGESSWQNVPSKYIFEIAPNQWWDIRFLLHHFTYVLNQHVQTMPRPVYPYNPLTRVRYTQKQLQRFFQRIRELKIEVNIAVLHFAKSLSKMKKWLTISDAEMVNRLTKELNLHLRFQLRKCDSTNLVLEGHWVRQNKQLSAFERLYREWLNLSLFFFPRSNNKKTEKWKELIASKSDSWSILADDTRALLDEKN